MQKLEKEYTLLQKLKVKVSVTSGIFGTWGILDLLNQV